MGAAVFVMGLSPRERGNRRPAHRRAGSRGSIPARAGEPAADHSPSASLKGLSPRERGNLLLRLAALSRTRSIPARAGEPKRRSWNSTATWVYPRASGGTGDAGLTREQREGLSPRERGNHTLDRRTDARLGSIPARAGEPQPSRSKQWLAAVYPRASGGTRMSPGWSSRSTGLSPRERGNLDGATGPHHRARSIPARAGNPDARQVQDERLRSIPARAGEPAPAR